MTAMTHDEFSLLAKQYGFERVYFTEPMKFDLGGNRFNLISDVKKVCPSADSIAVLVYPYAPFTPDEHIPSYYIASNKAYHASKEFIRKLENEGVNAEKVDIPVKLQLAKSHIGSICRNSLIAFEEYGTRVVLLSVAVEGILPKKYNEKNIGCGSCTACMDICPGGAINEQGFTFGKCLRFYMNPADHPDYIRDVQKTYLGCEICQYICPRNKFLACCEPSEDMKQAFDLKRLISGNASKAREYVGRNFSGNGKLTAEAIVFAAREGLYRDEIRNCLDSEFEAVRNAALYAENLFAGNTEKNGKSI